MPSRTCSRRGFLKGCAAAAASFAAPHYLRAGASPNEKLNLAFVGAGGRGASLIAELRPGGEPAGLLRRRRDLRGQQLQGASAGAAVHGLPQDVRRNGAADRRRGRRHARPSSLPGLDDGPAARQARLLREAADVHDRAGPAAGQGRPGEEAGHADGQPGQLQRQHAVDSRVDQGGRAGRGPGDPPLERLSHGRPPAAATGRRSRPASIGTCGSARSPRGRSPRARSAWAGIRTATSATA